MLRINSSGAPVRELQSLLVKAGWQLVVDGKFGPATESAVEAFQRKHGLVVDGKAGPLTMAKLRGQGNPTAPDVSAPPEPFMRVTDISGDLPQHPSKRYRLRNLSQITQIVVHHTAGPVQQSPNQIANYHVKINGWPGIAYHYLIAPQGTVYLCNAHDRVTNHAKGQNTISLGICLIGDFTNSPPPAAQIQALGRLVDNLWEQIPTAKKLIPHRKVKGSATACPGDRFPFGILEGM